jgi:glucose-1-phosphate thymidylyltransferase
LFGVEIAKALILAGRSHPDQPWPSVRSGPKHLVPVANRPILFHNLESLRRAGMLEAAIAVEPESAEAIHAAVGDGAAWNLAVRYVEWSPASGIGGALAAARQFVADEPVLVGPGDALHRGQIHPHIATFADQRLDALTLRLSGAPRDHMGQPVAGGHLLSRLAVKILTDAPGATGDPMSGIRRQGGHVRTQDVDGCLPCHGGQDALLDGNRRILEDLQGDPDLSAFSTCTFQGPVLVHPTAQLDHTLVRGPAIIGAGTRLSHAYVGPYTSIGSGVTIDGSQVEHSIVLDGASLLHVGARLESSVIGRGARIAREFSLPSSMRVSVGDGAQVTLT